MEPSEESGTVDREAETVESTEEADTVPQDDPTVPRPHLLSLLYTPRTPTPISCKFPTRRLTKAGHLTFTMGRGLDTDVLLNEEHMPRKFAEFICRLEEREARWFVKNICKNKNIRISRNGSPRIKVKPTEVERLEEGDELKLETLTFTVRAEEGDVVEGSEIELELRAQDDSGSSSSGGSYHRQQSSSSDSTGSLTSAHALAHRTAARSSGPVVNGGHAGPGLVGPGVPAGGLHAPVLPPGQYHAGLPLQSVGPHTASAGHTDSGVSGTTIRAPGYDPLVHPQRYPNPPHPNSSHPQPYGPQHPYPYPPGPQQHHYPHPHCPNYDAQQACPNPAQANYDQQAYPLQATYVAHQQYYNTVQKYSNGGTIQPHHIDPYTRHQHPGTYYNPGHYPPVTTPDKPHPHLLPPSARLNPPATAGAQVPRQPVRGGPDMYHDPSRQAYSPPVNSAYSQHSLRPPIPATHASNLDHLAPELLPSVTWEFSQTSPHPYHPSHNAPPGEQPGAFTPPRPYHPPQPVPPSLSQHMQESQRGQGAIQPQIAVTEGFPERSLSSYQYPTLHSHAPHQQGLPGHTTGPQLLSSPLHGPQSMPPRGQCPEAVCSAAQGQGDSRPAAVIAQPESAQHVLDQAQPSMLHWAGGSDRVVEVTGEGGGPGGQQVMPSVCSPSGHLPAAPPVTLMSRLVLNDPVQVTTTLPTQQVTPSPTNSLTHTYTHTQQNPLTHTSSADNYVPGSLGPASGHEGDAITRWDPNLQHGEQDVGPAWGATGHSAAVTTTGLHANPNPTTPSSANLQPYDNHSAPPRLDHVTLLDTPLAPPPLSSLMHAAANGNHLNLRGAERVSRVPPQSCDFASASSYMVQDLQGQGRRAEGQRGEGHRTEGYTVTGPGRQPQEDDERQPQEHDDQG